MSQLQETTALIDRQKCIENNIDALGKQWEILHVKATALYVARPKNGNETSAIPDEMRGKWTKPSDLQTRIELYLGRSWDMADKAQVKADRKAQAIKENLSKSVDVGFTTESKEAKMEEKAAIAEILTQPEEKDARKESTEAAIPTESRA